MDMLRFKISTQPGSSSAMKLRASVHTLPVESFKLNWTWMQPSGHVWNAVRGNVLASEDDTVFSNWGCPFSSWELKWVPGSTFVIGQVNQSVWSTAVSDIRANGSYTHVYYVIDGMVREWTKPSLGWWKWLEFGLWSRGMLRRRFGYHTKVTWNPSIKSNLN